MLNRAMLIMVLLVLSGCALSTPQPPTATPMIAVRPLSARPVYPQRPIYPSNNSDIVQHKEHLDFTRITTFTSTAAPDEIRQWYRKTLLAAGWQVDDDSMIKLPESDNYIYLDNNADHPAFEFVLSVTHAGAMRKVTIAHTLSGPFDTDLWPADQ